MQPVLSDAIFKALVESLPDSVVIAGKDGTILLVNAQTEALFGYERAELVDQPVETLVPEELREAHRGHRTQYARYPGTRPMGIGLELLGRRKDGSRFPIEIGLSPLIRGEQMFVTAVIRDITERARLRGELEMQRDRQRIAMDLHDGTIQSVYAIGLGLELALADIVSDPVEAGRRVDASIDQLNGVIHDIRAYIFDLRPVQFDGDLLQDLTATIEEFRASSALNVAADLTPSVPTLNEDRAVALLHITREALSNARKHAQAHTVTVSLSHAEGYVAVEVLDDGVGFNAEDQQASVHRGLRNMRLRTQRLGGMFDVESTPGAGTTVRVHMPTGN